MSSDIKQAIWEIGNLANRLQQENWERQFGVQLANTAFKVETASRQLGWLEAAGRARELSRLANESVLEPPSRDQRERLLHAARNLARLLDRGQSPDPLNQELLPVDPEAWTFILAGNDVPEASNTRETLLAAGFNVLLANDQDEVCDFSAQGPSILLADADWLAENPVAGGENYAANDAAHVLWQVALVNGHDLFTQLRARQSGADLLLDFPLDVPHLLQQLAGRAWAPRTPYRVLLVDDDSNRLAGFARPLRGNPSIDLQVLDDPTGTLFRLDDFAPDILVLSMSMGVCHAPDLAALCHHHQDFLHLPVLYIDYAAPEHGVDNDDFLPQPLDEHRFLTTVLARARKYRLLRTSQRQQRRAERQLEQVRGALDRHAIVSVSDLDGTIVAANWKFCETSGYPLDELIGRNHRIVKSGHHAPDFFRQMWSTISGGEVWQGEVQNRRKDGTPYWVQATVFPVLDENGLPESYISVRTDITAQKQAQFQGERHARLLELLRQAFQDYITTHDLGATAQRLLEGMMQLTGSGYGFIAEVMADEQGSPYLKTHAISDISWAAGTLREQQQLRANGLEFHGLDTLFGAVLRSGERVITNQVDTDPRHGNLPPGHPPLRTFLGVPVYYGKTLVGMVALANSNNGYDNATLDLLSPFLSAYGNILEAARMRRFQRQVMSELSEARDAAERAAQERAALQHAQLHDLQHAGTDWITLRQQAAQLFSQPDLPAAVQSFLADLIEQLPTANAPAPGGTGIRTGIPAPAATVTGFSTPAAPSLPDSPTPPPANLTPPSRATLIPDEPPRPSQGSAQILIAEDNIPNQHLLRMQLETLGWQADVANHGIEALSRWQDGCHRLLLVDLQMPEMDGQALARAIRAAEVGTNTPTILIGITGGWDTQLRQNCREAGFDDLLPKPIELDALRQLLQQWLPGAGTAEDISRPAPLSKESETAAIDGTAIDLAALIRAVGPTSPEQLRTLLDLFTSHTAAELPEAIAACQLGDSRRLAQLMHKLKSSAASVGARRFARLAEDIEVAAQEKRVGDAAPLLNQLAHALSDIEECVVSLPSLGGIPEASAGELLAPEMRPQAVLIVDDDIVVRRQLSLLLNGLGIDNIATATDGDSALALLAEQTHSPGATPIELILTDIHMPGMDGIEFMQRLTELHYRGGIILNSGVDDRLLQNAVELARLQGLNLRGGLRKPVSRGALLHLLSSSTERIPSNTNPRPQFQIGPQDLLDGIERDQFTVYFQPKVDTVTLAPVGLEALARWDRGVAGFIPPDVFVRAAEEHQLIGRLSVSLIVKALQGWAELAHEGHPLHLAINLSATWLTDLRLPEFIASTVATAGMKPEQLTLEITETGVMGDASLVLSVITRLRLKGFRLSIDDFGTGYSSMEQLARLPFSELKLDRSFVQGAANHPSARTILASSIDMARRLGLNTVAEGVETQADLDLMRGLGCHEIQGWLVAKAMPIADLKRWLKDYGDLSHS